ncbi:MAG: carbamate kinase [Candidatus Thermoplasmatota archaeon]|jgi:carbamate kinase|nr:carbamate kinase [Candidatus Thermoplasmatota archaeon]
MDKILIALGGNALLRNGDDRTYESQVKRASEAFEKLYDIIKDNDVVITHGNGPQVGDIMIQNDMAKSVTPPMPIDVCGSMSQGLIAQILLTSYESVRKRLSGDGKSPVYVLTRTLVDEKDEAFENPSKFVGPFYSRDEAMAIMKEKGWPMKQQGQKGWRRVVPSPMPRSIVEKDAILSLLSTGYVPICVGGGGTPVIRNSSGIVGIEAVIDKDLASSVLASSLGFERLMILTDVDNVFINYGKPNEKSIGKITLAEIEQLYRNGTFPEGSMGPKVKSAIQFLRNGGKVVNITSLERCYDALTGDYGTVILPD